jgi:hypothetical protein
MLPTEIRVTTNDINYAEKILLSRGERFDIERRDFIRNLDTIDLQAVPGSGKTTALLAKLLILERYMPFDDGSGVLVISHTNTAVDEIKNKIGSYCPRLFAYPNFVGTIQSFVDQFLAIPFYLNEYKKRPYRIDSEIYDENIRRCYEKTNGAGWKTWIDNNGGLDFLKKIRLDNNYNLIPNLSKTKNDFKLKDNTKSTYKSLISVKKTFLEYGYLHFDDAYLLANLYILKFPQIKKLLQKRFKYVFVDEMQDMEKHQYEILEKLFFTKKILGHCYQRIGDKNQAIYGGDIKLENIWYEGGRKKVHLKGSHRFNQKVADVVKYFALDYQEIKSLRVDCNIKPHIIVFKKPEDVLSCFAKIIKDNKLSDKKHPFCAIGWSDKEKYYTETDAKKRKGIKTGDINPNKYIIRSYYPNFNKKYNKLKNDYLCLKDYLKYYNKNDNTLASIKKNILNIFVKILRFNDTKDENDRNYTTAKLMNYLKENYPEKYEEFKLKLFEWSFSLKKGNDIYDDLENYLPSFFKESSAEADNFISSEKSPEIKCINNKTKIENPNIFKDKNNDIEIKIGTIHSVKGETHTATLYMESFYRKGRGNYESERLIDQLKENKKIDETIKNIKTCHDLIKKSAKMAYVGCSRPTHLLCFAIHEDRFNKDFNNSNWEIIKINK